MSAAPHNDKIEDAPRVSGAERGDNESDLKHEEPVLLKSSHDSLGYWATARIFWKVSCLTDNVRGWESPVPPFFDIRHGLSMLCNVLMILSMHSLFLRVI